MKSPAFQVYVNDFLGSAKVGMMSTEEIGAYWLLLFLEWQEIGFVYNEQQLSRWCRLTPSRFRKAWVALKPCFVEIDGRLYNPRLQKEREKQEAWRDKSAKGGKRSGEARSKGGSQMVQPTPQPNGNTPLQLPLQSPVTTKKKRGKASPEEPSGLDLLSQPDADRAWKKWGECFGAMDRWLFRKELLKAYQPGLPVYTSDEIVDGIQAAHDWFVEQDDKEQSFFTLGVFVRQLGSKWVRFGKMDTTSGGELTERGMWAGSKAIRENARQSRVFA